MRKKKKNEDTGELGEDINEYYDTDKLINIEGDPIDPEDIKKAERRIRKKQTENDSDGEAEEKKASKKKKTAFFISLFAFILVVLLIVSYVFFAPDFKSVNGNIRSMFMSLSTDSYPVSVDSDGVRQFKAYKNGFVLLNDSSVSQYSSSGNSSDLIQFDYSSPQIVCGGRNLLVYDRGEKNFRIVRGSRSDQEIELPSKIITCDISKSGYYAFSTVGDEPASVLSVYSDSGEKVFEFNSADNYISSLSLSKNNRRIAAAVIGASNAHLVSKISVFDFKYNQAYVSLDVDDVIVDIQYIARDKVMIVGKNGVYLLNDNELTALYSFTNDSLEYYGFYDNGLCIVTQSGADSDENNVIRFTKNGEIKTKTKINGKVKGFSATDHYAAVLLSDSVECVGYNGEITGKIGNIKYASGIVANGDCVYVLSVNSIDRFSAYSDYSVEKAEHTTGSGSLEG